MITIESIRLNKLINKNYTEQMNSVKAGLLKDSHIFNHTQMTPPTFSDSEGSTENAYVILKNKKIIGLIWLSCQEFSNGIYITHSFITTEQRKKGYGFKAWVLLQKELKNMKHIRLLLSYIWKNNIASISLRIRLGFTYCGEIKQYGYHGGVMDSMVIYQKIL